MQEKHHYSQPKQPIPFWAELSRKGVHLSSLLISVVAGFLGAQWALRILIPFFLFALFMDVARVYSPAIAQWVQRVFGFMMRDFEVKPHHIVFNGATWVLFSAVLTFSIFPKSIAIASFSILILGDAFAALIGRRFGRIKIGQTGKSLEGSLAFVVASMTVYPFVADLGFWNVFIAASAGAFIEVLPIALDDNIRIPMVAGIVLSLLTGFMPSFHF